MNAQLLAANRYDWQGLLVLGDAAEEEGDDALAARLRRQAEILRELGAAIARCNDPLYAVCRFQQGEVAGIAYSLRLSKRTITLHVRAGKRRQVTKTLHRLKIGRPTLFGVSTGTPDYLPRRLRELFPLFDCE